MCVLSNERYKTYQRGFSLCSLGHAPGVGLRGAGAPRWSKKSIDSNMVMWLIKIDGDDEQNASNIFILWSNWLRWGEVKRSNIIYMSISKVFIPNSLCVFSQIKKIENILNRIFILLPGSCPGLGLVGAWGSQKL